MTTIPASLTVCRTVLMRISFNLASMASRSADCTAHINSQQAALAPSMRGNLTLSELLQ